jgi:hypothetical protein
MGLVNMIEKPNIKSCQELTNEEIKEASDNLVRKIKYYRPKVVAFNGKTIYEIYTGTSVDKLFDFGKQPVKFANNTCDTYMFVMPSSSARCSQLPKVIDKVPFYLALKKFRDYLNGHLMELNDADITFPDFKVALEVDNANDSKLDSTTNNGVGSDIEDDDDVAVDESLNLQSNNNHKIKFVRLNNLAYSQIPFDIMSNLKVQRQMRKNVTITTTKDYFNLKTNFSSINSNSNGGHKLPTKVKSHFPNALSNASCSDVETASTATNDSMDFNINNNDQNDTINTSTNFNSSKLSSLILNVCNNSTNTNSYNQNNNNNNSSKQNLSSSFSSQPIKTILQQQQNNNNQTTSIEKLNDLANQLTSKQLVNNPKDAKIRNLISKPALDQIKQFNQPTTTQQVPVTPINNSNNNIIIVSSPQIIQAPTQQNVIIVSNNDRQVVNNSQSNLVPVLIEEEYEDHSTDPYAEFELLRQDDLNDYYTFDSTPVHSNPSIYLTDDYSTALRHDLGRSIKLFFDDDYLSNANNCVKKRRFSNVNDATNFIANNILNKIFINNSNKRQCKIDMKNL